MTDENVPSPEPSYLSTSLSLLELAKENDPTAWDRIVDLYSPLVYRWCRNFGLQEANVLDVSQDVFRSVSQNLAQFRKEKPQDSFRKWLKTITNNKVKDHWNRCRRQPEPIGGSEAKEMMENVSESPISESSEEVVSDRLELLRRAIEMVRIEFEPKSWEAFWKVTVDEMSPTEVAEELGVSVNVVYLSKSRVLARFKVLFAELIEDVDL
jgi:RNA polymerase sigma-70 factor, ECF subfamily